MTIENCQEHTRASKVKVRERGKSAVFINKSKVRYCKTQIDGCVVKNSLAADWIVTKVSTGDVIVELKGRDVHHGVQQILATAQLWRERSMEKGRIAGLIVAVQYPKEDTSVQQAREKFARAFKGPMHVVTKNGEYIFERVLEFSGPLGKPK